MKRILFSIILFPVLLFFSVIHVMAAETIKWPVVASLIYAGAGSGGSYQSRYTVSWAMVEFDAPSNVTGGCSGIMSGKCRFGTYHTDGSLAVQGNNWTSLTIPDNPTWAAISAAVFSFLGESGSYTPEFSTTYVKIGCVGFFLTDYNTVANPKGVTASTFAAKMTTPAGSPYAGCVVPPPANEWCSLTTPSITFDYGTGTLANFRSNPTRTNNVNAECSSASDSGTKYVLKLAGSDSSELSLSNGMSAEFTADGKALGETLVGFTGNNTVKIDSTLSGDPTDTGAFSGSSILIVSYP